MSWDASLTCNTGCGNEGCLGEWNYTHNTNPMVTAAAKASGFQGKHWLDILEGGVGRDVGQQLDLIIKVMEAEPEVYQAMNASNGWGKYDTLLSILRKMQKASVAHPGGVWSVSR